MTQTEHDCVIGFSFGTSIEKGSVNAQLSKMMIDQANGRPIIADQKLVNAFPKSKQCIAHIIEGVPTYGLNQGLTTWRIWIEAQRYMTVNGLSKPLIIAQSYHAPRVIKQGRKIGLNSEVPDSLPTGFDPKSEQFWTRSIYLWLPFNSLFTAYLKLLHQI